MMCEIIVFAVGACSWCSYSATLKSNIKVLFNVVMGCSYIAFRL